MPQSPRPIFFWIIASLALLLAAPAPAQEQAVSPQSAKRGPVPQPNEILQKMCDFLKSQPAFSYKAEVSDDQVFQGGKKLQFAIDMETWVRRPDRL